MKEEIREKAFCIFGLAVSGTYSSLPPGHEPNFELLAAQAIEAALEFEHKCQQEEKSEVVSRVVRLKRAYKKGYGMFMRGEPSPAPSDDEESQEVAHGWHRAQHDAAQ